MFERRTAYAWRQRWIAESISPCSLHQMLIVFPLGLLSTAVAFDIIYWSVTAPCGLRWRAGRWE